MRMKRFITGAVAAGLLGLTPLALAAAPAQADTIITRVSPDGLATKIQAGQKFSVVGKVEYSTNGGASWAQVPFGSGSVVLQRQLKGSSTWSTVSTDQYGDSFYIYPVTATKNANYRLVYSGGTANGQNFPAASASGYQAVLRKIDVKTRYGSLVVSAKVTPDFKRKKVVVQVKRGGWKTWRKVKTDKKGKMKVKLVGNRKGIKYRFLVKGDKSYSTTYSGVIRARTYRY